MKIGHKSSNKKQSLFRRWLKSRQKTDEEKYNIYKNIFDRAAKAAEIKYYKEKFSTNWNCESKLESTGIVPKKLKLAKVITVYKKGPRSFACNYRPISLLSIFDKKIKKLVCTRLLKFLNKYNTIYEFQFGFRKQHSSLLALLEVVDGIYQSLDDGNFVAGMYFDLKKAFDIVDHDILINKLDNYGLDELCSIGLKLFN